MKKRALRLLVLPLASAAAGSASSYPPTTPTDPDRPNVVLIFADDLGYGDLPPYGHPYARTPNIDRLATHGTVFKNFHVTGATCNPSRTGLMTSRHPAWFDNYMGDFGLQGVRTVTEALHDAGYRVGHFGKWHIGPEQIQVQGMYGMDRIEIIGGNQGHDDGRDAGVFKAAMDFIDGHATEELAEGEARKPLYINIWGHITHSPVSPPEEMVELFEDVELNADDFGRGMREKIDDFGGGRRAEEAMREYVAELWALDIQVGLLLDLLEERGMTENTIVAFSSDQGPTPSYMGSSDPFRGGKFEFLEGGVRVPFILSWPGRVKNGTVNEHSLMSALDWMPTLCSIAGARCNPRMMEGEDMSDVWLGMSVRSRQNPLFWSLSTRSRGKIAMLYRDWKLFADYDGGGRELYDLTANPEEDDNIYDENQEIGDAMAARLMEWFATLPDRYCKKDNGCYEDDIYPFYPNVPPVIFGPPEILIPPTEGPTSPPSPVPSPRPTAEPPALPIDGGPSEEVGGGGDDQTPPMPPTDAEGGGAEADGHGTTVAPTPSPGPSEPGGGDGTGTGAAGAGAGRTSGAAGGVRGPTTAWSVVAAAAAAGGALVAIAWGC